MLNLIKEVYQNYFEIASAMFASLVIVLAYILDKVFFLQACAMCILTRYAFGLIILTSLISYLLKSKFSYLLMILSSSFGIFITSKQIYIQNLTVEELSSLSGCGIWWPKLRRGWYAFYLKFCRMGACFLCVLLYFEFKKSIIKPFFTKICSITTQNHGRKSLKYSI